MGSIRNVDCGSLKHWCQCAALPAGVQEPIPNLSQIPSSQKTQPYSKFILPLYTFKLVKARTTRNFTVIRVDCINFGKLMSLKQNILYH